MAFTAPGVIDYKADTIVANQEHADLATVEGLRTWRDMVIAEASRSLSRCLRPCKAA